MAKQKPLKFVFFGCPHVPLHDEAAISSLLSNISKFQPDVVIHGGDGHEADAASRWYAEYQFSLEDEYRIHNELLANLRKAAPKARRVFLLGNHDANLLAWGRLDKRVRDVASFFAHEPELKHWKVIPYVNDRRHGCFRARPGLTP